MDSSGPVGIFDSGSGGLVAAKRLSELLPMEQILYVGDTARMPYGSRSRDEIAVFSGQLAAFLLRRGAKILIAACGTVSTNFPSLRRLPVPAFGVVGAAARRAASVTRSGKVGLFATPATLRSGSFERALRDSCGPGVLALSDPSLARDIERGADFSAPGARDRLRGALRPFLDFGIDTLVLGCTHYPLIAPVFRDLLGSGVTLVDCAAEAASEAAAYLTSHQLAVSGRRRPDRFYFTSGAAAAAVRAKRLLRGWDILPDTFSLPPEELLQGGVFS